jgi:FkbM family methyltransferase
MEGSTDQVKALPLILEAGLLAREPFVLLDAGCSGGIDGVWRIFGDDLVAFGFDPQRSECRRLQEAETRPGVEYVAAFVGLPKGHPFLLRRESEDEALKLHFNPWERLSTADAVRRGARAAMQSQPILEDWVSLDDIVPLDAFVRERNLATVDFIKIDVDGTDLDVVLSAESITRSHQILGFAIEVNWTGSHLETDNTFHNIDRHMRRMGYSLVGATHRTYSRQDLPAPFIYDVLAQTHGGQPIQGDAIYLRDAASGHDATIWGAPLGPRKLLKLLALHEMFRLPDMAAELLNAGRDVLAGLINVDRMLDVLTPPLNGESLSYRDYMAAFRADPTILLPQNRREPAAEAIAMVRPCDAISYSRHDVVRMIAAGSGAPFTDWLPWLTVDAAGRQAGDGVAARRTLAGYVLSGPYWSVASGLYRMQVCLRTADASSIDGDMALGEIDVADAGRVLACAQVLGRHLSDGVASLDFEIGDIAGGDNRIEARLLSSGVASFDVTAVRIEPRVEPLVVAAPPVVAPEAEPPAANPLLPLPLHKKALVALTPPLLLNAARTVWRGLRDG